MRDASWHTPLGGPTGEMSSSGLRNCENGDCIVGSRARYKVYTGGTDPLRQSHVLAHTRATPAFTKRHDNVQPPLGARARGDAELATGHREGAINRYRSRRQRRRAQSEPVHASGQHFTRATLAPVKSGMNSGYRSRSLCLPDRIHSFTGS